MAQHGSDDIMNTPCTARAAPRRAARPSAREAGFSLVEILGAIAVLGILASIAAPQVADLSRAMQVDAAAHQLAGDLERARSEAIKRNRSVKLTPGTTTYTIQYIGVEDLGDATLIEAPDSVKFAPFGPVAMGGVQFVLTVGDHAKTVSLDASGHARVE